MTGTSPTKRANGEEIERRKRVGKISAKVRGCGGLASASSSGGGGTLTWVLLLLLLVTRFGAIAGTQRRDEDAWLAAAVGGLGVCCGDCAYVDRKR